MDNSGGVFACVFSIALLAAIFGTIVLLRWFKHREIIALAEKGLLPAQYARTASMSRSRGSLGWGVALAAIGLALIIGLWPIGLAGIGVVRYPLGFGPWMLIGLLPMFIGLALLITYFITRKNGNSEPEPPAEKETNAAD